MSIICSGCEGINDRAPRQRLCRKCHAAYQRSWRSSRISVPRESVVFIDDEILHVATAVAALEGRAG